MSVHVTSPIYKLNLKGEAKAVLLVFGDHANPDGQNSCPSLSLVSLEAGFSLRTVKRYVDAFRHDRVLVVEENQGSGRRSAIYRIDLERAAAIYGMISKSAPEVPFSTPGPPKKKGQSDTFPGDKKSVTVSNKSATVSKEKCHSDTLTIKEPSEPNVRARARGAPPPPDPCGGSGNAGPPEQVGDKPGSPTEASAKEEPANRHWNSKRSEMADHLGAAWGSWFKQAIVLSDDGAVVVIGVPTEIWRTRCEGLAPNLEPILGRKIQVALHNLKWLATVHKQEAQKQGTPP